MTARPEAPTLKEKLDEQIAYAKGVVDVMDSDEARAILASLISFRAIEQAAEMPEEPTRYTEEGAESPSGLLVFYDDYKELTDRCLYLTDRLARMEALQAHIDELMLEYCPDEMTPEQIEEWGKHQKPVSEETAARIDTALLAKLEKEKE